MPRQPSYSKKCCHSGYDSNPDWWSYDTRVTCLATLVWGLNSFLKFRKSRFPFHLKNKYNDLNFIIYIANLGRSSPGTTFWDGTLRIADDRCHHRSRIYERLHGCRVLLFPPRICSFDTFSSGPRRHDFGKSNDSCRCPLLIFVPLFSRV